MWCHSYIPLGINPNFFGLSLCERQIVYALRTRAPVLVTRRQPLPRLACVRPAASVHPEPGSNSSSLKSFISSNRSSSYWLQVSLNPLNLSLCCTTLCQCTCCFSYSRGITILFCGCKGITFLFTYKIFIHFFWKSFMCFGKWLITNINAIIIFRLLSVF